MNSLKLVVLISVFLSEYMLFAHESEKSDLNLNLLFSLKFEEALLSSYASNEKGSILDDRKGKIIICSVEQVLNNDFFIHEQYEKFAFAKLERRKKGSEVFLVSILHSDDQSCAYSISFKPEEHLTKASVVESGGISSKHPFNLRAFRKTNFFCEENSFCYSKSTSPNLIESFSFFQDSEPHTEFIPLNFPVMQNSEDTDDSDEYEYSSWDLIVIIMTPILTLVFLCLIMLIILFCHRVVLPRIKEMYYSRYPIQIPGKMFDPADAEFSPTHSSCSICLDPLNGNQKLRELRCGHQFHNDCIERWVKTKPKCPICQQNIRKAQNYLEEGRKSQDYSHRNSIDAQNDSSGNLNTEIEIQGENPEQA